jgi:hypothetical protein
VGATCSSCVRVIRVAESAEGLCLADLEARKPTRARHDDNIVGSSCSSAVLVQAEVCLDLLCCFVRAELGRLNHQMAIRIREMPFTRGAVVSVPLA